MKKQGESKRKKETHLLVIFYLRDGDKLHGLALEENLQSGEKVGGG